MNRSVQDDFRYFIFIFMRWDQEDPHNIEAREAVNAVFEMRCFCFLKSAKKSKSTGIKTSLILKRHGLGHLFSPFPSARSCFLVLGCLGPLLRLELVFLVTHSRTVSSLCQ